jgi:hypothetical protein
MPSISDAAVAAKTGRTWAQWFKALDARGARKLDHRRIVAIVTKGFDVGPWWRQMVTVEYERARGLRDMHQQGSTYTVNVSRTMPAPAARLFDAWHDARRRGRWLPRPRVTLRSATRPRTVRLGLADGSLLDVRITGKGPRKAQVAVEHSKLASRAAVERQRACWKARLAALEAQVAA